MTKKELDNLIKMIQNEDIRSILKAANDFTGLAIERLVKYIIDLEGRNGRV